MNLKTLPDMHETNREGATGLSPSSFEKTEFVFLHEKHQIKDRTLILTGLLDFRTRHFIGFFYFFCLLEIKLKGK